MINNYGLRSLVDFNGLQFENAIVENIVFSVTKRKSKDDLVKILRGKDSKIILDKLIEINKFRNNKNFTFNINSDEFIDNFFENKQSLSYYCNINQAIALKGDKLISVKTAYKKGYYKLLDGRNINKYSIEWTGNYLDYSIDRIHSCKRKDIFECKEKLMFRRVSASLIFSYDNEQYYALNTIVVVTAKSQNFNMKYLLGLLNSKLINFIYTKKFKSTKTVFSEIQARSVGELPIVLPSTDFQENISELVDKILSAKKADNSADTSAMEAEIDRLVYSLYGLTEEEIKIVEGR